MATETESQEPETPVDGGPAVETAEVVKDEGGQSADAPARHVARHRFARITARKARLAADLVRGRSVNQALDLLRFAPQRSAAFFLKVLESAVANAAQDPAVNVNRLFVVDARADDGPLLQGRMRWRPGPQGRAMPYRKRTSHLTIVVQESAENTRRGA